LRQAFDFKEQAKRSEKYYFQPKRPKAATVVEEHRPAPLPIHHESQSKLEVESLGSIDNTVWLEEVEQVPYKSPDSKQTTALQYAKDILLDSYQNSPNSNQCSECKKILSTKCKLKLHIEAVHAKIKSFACGLCPKSFTHKHDLKRHVNYRHMYKDYNDRPFQCDIDDCNLRFKLIEALKKHQSVKHGSEYD